MLPDKITIGCFDYKVVETDDPIIVDGNACRGSIDFNDNIIRIKKSGMSDQVKEQVFWHEVVHGILEYRTTSVANNSEESIVEEISRGIYAIMKQNGILPGQKIGG